MWEGVGDWTKTATHWPPQPLRASPCIVLVLLDCSTGGLGAQPLWDMFSFQHLLSNWSGLQTRWGSQGPLRPSGGFLYHILSPTHLISNSVEGPEGPFCWVVAFHILSPAHSIFGMACLIVIKRKITVCSSEVTLFRCISLWVYHGLLPCPISSAKSAYAISSHNCHRNVSLPSSASLWNGMFGRIEGQYTTLWRIG